MDKQSYLKLIDKVIEQGPFKDTWESLEQYDVAKWYQKAKFGIFIHWGLYSIPAFGSEWYSRNMYIQGSKEYEHHIKTYGPQKEFGYKDFIPMFKAEKFDPEVWADLFEKLGRDMSCLSPNITMDSKCIKVISLHSTHMKWDLNVIF